MTTLSIQGINARSSESNLKPTNIFLSVFNGFKPGFRALHCSEAALVKVTYDLLLAADRGDCLILVLLDVIAAFNTVNHGLP